MSQKPEYPLTVYFEDTGETCSYENEEEIVTSLEWFDSEDKKDKVNVTDSRGRLVRLKIERLEIVILELISPETT